MCASARAKAWAWAWDWDWLAARPSMTATDAWRIMGGRGPNARPPKPGEEVPVGDVVVVVVVVVVEVVVGSAKG